MLSAAIGSLLGREDASSNVVATAAVALLVAAGVFVATSSHSKSSNPLTKDGKPLPWPSTTLPLLGNTLDFTNNSARMHDWICETSIGFGGKPWLLQALRQPKMVILTSPQAFEDVERKFFDKFGKGVYQQEYLHDFLGNGIVNADGEMWAYQRKTIANLFSSRALRESMAAIIHKHSITMDAVLEKAATSDTEVDVSKLMHQFTMEAFTEIGFGLELGSLGSDGDHPFETAFDHALHCIMTRMQLPMFVWKLQRFLGIGLEGDLKKCMKMLNKTVVAVIERTMAKAKLRGSTGGGASKDKDIVSLFLESEHSKGKLTAELLRDIVLNMLLGGRDTSAEALSWLFYCLSQHPEVERKIRAEIAAKIGSSTNASDRLDVNVLQQLTYIEAALKETLRLYPVANFNMRYSFEDVVMTDGTFIPAGSYAVMCPYSTARRTDVWGDDAAEFKPERWLNPSNPEKLVPVSSYKFNSFLGGPRGCLGMNLAMMQMKTVVVKTLRKFHFELSPGQQHVTYRHSLTLPIKGGLRVRVQRL